MSSEASQWIFLNRKVSEILLFLSIWVYWIWMSINLIIWPPKWVIWLTLLHGFVTIFAFYGVLNKDFKCLVLFLLMNLALQILVQLDMIYLVYFYAHAEDTSRKILFQILLRSSDEYHHIIQDGMFSYYLFYRFACIMYILAVTILLSLVMADFRKVTDKRRQFNLLYDVEGRFPVTPLTNRNNLIQRLNVGNEISCILSPGTRYIFRTPPPAYRTFLGTLFGTPKGTPPPHYSSPFFTQAKK